MQTLYFRQIDVHGLPAKLVRSDIATVVLHGIKMCLRNSSHVLPQMS